MKFVKLESKNCELCGEPFEYNPRNKRSSIRRFCSLLCAQKNVYLCTDSSINLVNEKLKKLGFITSIRHNNRIFFDKNSSIVFLDWISKNIEIQKEYLYKWKK